MSLKGGMPSKDSWQRFQQEAALYHAIRHHNMLDAVPLPAPAPLLKKRETRLRQEVETKFRGGEHRLGPLLKILGFLFKPFFLAITLPFYLIFKLLPAWIGWLSHWVQKIINTRWISFKRALNHRWIAIISPFRRGWLLIKNLKSILINKIAVIRNRCNPRLLARRLGVFFQSISKNAAALFQRLNLNIKRIHLGNSLLKTEASLRSWSQKGKAFLFHALKAPFLWAVQRFNMMLHRSYERYIATPLRMFRSIQTCYRGVIHQIQKEQKRAQALSANLKNLSRNCLKAFVKIDLNVKAKMFVFIRIFSIVKEKIFQIQNCLTPVNELYRLFSKPMEQACGMLFCPVKKFFVRWRGKRLSWQKIARMHAIEPLQRLHLGGQANLGRLASYLKSKLYFSEKTIGRKLTEKVNRSRFLQPFYLAAQEARRGLHHSSAILQRALQYATEKASLHCLYFGVWIDVLWSYGLQLALELAMRLMPPASSE